MEICFVCTGNASRSPMAEVIAKKEIKELGLNWLIYSCGINAIEGQPVSKRAEIVCSEIGLNLTGIKRKRLRSSDINEKTIFVVMQTEHVLQLKELFGIPEDKIYLLGGGIPDPRDCDLDIYRLCRDRLIHEVNGLIRKLA